MDFEDRLGAAIYYFCQLDKGPILSASSSIKRNKRGNYL